MKPEQLLRAILPSVIVDNFDIDRFEKSADRFDIWLDEKKVQMREDKRNSDVIAYGFGEYQYPGLSSAWTCHMAACAQAQMT